MRRSRDHASATPRRLSARRGRPYRQRDQRLRDAQAFRFAVFELPGELVMQDHYADRAGLLARGGWVHFEIDAATRTLRQS